MTAGHRPPIEARNPPAAEQRPPAPAVAPGRSGVRHVPGAWGGSRSLLVLAGAVLVAAGAVAFWSSADEAEESVAGRGGAAQPPAPAARSADAPAPDRPIAAIATVATPVPPRPADAVPAAQAPGATALPQIVRQRDPDGDPTADLADLVNEGDLPSMAEVIRRLQAAGVYTGLGAFSPPGTRPPLIGLAVPEDFPLPAGFVRHYQATDDGQRIEPILMFAPPAVAGPERAAVPMPPDRVVPPEQAPAGLPIRRIELPAPLNGAARGG